MRIGTAILLIAAGAIVCYGLTFSVSGVSRPVIGLILIVAGIVGLVLSLSYTAAARRRVVAGALRRAASLASSATLPGEPPTGRPAHSQSTAFPLR